MLIAGMQAWTVNHALMMRLPNTFSRRFCPSVITIAFAAFLFSACATRKADAVLDRTVAPEVRADVPATASEIREVKYHKLGSEAGHETLHIRGQLYTKSTEGGTTRIQPCSSCVIQLNTPNDTSTHVRITTESDGYFVFNGRSGTYTISLTNPGHNPLQLGAIEFQQQGITTLRIINAAGSTPERFTVTKNGELYTWSKVQ
jgi:hypothetical protein